MRAAAASSRRPSTVMTSRSGSAWAPGSTRTRPLTVTRPAARKASAPRRELSPAWARILLRRIGGSRQLLVQLALGGIPGRGRLRDDQLALRLGQVGEVAQPEGDEEIARGLVEEGPARRVLAPAMRTRRRSSRLSSTPSEFTPRTASTSGRDTGWR